MNEKSIDQARSADLRGSWPALQRAAQHARERAAQTGTDLIISRGGVITRIKPLPVEHAHQVQEADASYVDKQ